MFNTRINNKKTLSAIKILYIIITLIMIITFRNTFSPGVITSVTNKCNLLVYVTTSFDPGHRQVTIK